MGTGKAWCLLTAARVMFAVELPQGAPMSGHTTGAPGEVVPMVWRQLVNGGIVSMSSFGDRLACLTLKAKVVDAGTLCTNSPIHFYSEVGTILLAQRGECTFVVKARNAQRSGALALLVFDPTRRPPQQDGQPTIQLPNGAAEQQAPPKVEEQDAIVMGDDGTGSDVTIPAIGLTHAMGQQLLVNIRRAAADGGKVYVRMEGLEVAMATFGSVESEQHPLGWMSRPAQQFKRCGVEAQSGSGGGGGGKMEHVEVVNAPGGVDFGRLLEEGESSCVPPERTFPMNSYAFSDSEWARLRERQPCA